MDLASAYPDSDISTGAMIMIAIVTVVVLAVWLGSVYLAERNTQARARQARETRPVPAPGHGTADDEHSGAGGAGEAGRRAAAA